MNSTVVFSNSFPKIPFLGQIWSLNFKVLYLKWILKLLKGADSDQSKKLFESAPLSTSLYIFWFKTKQCEDSGPNLPKKGISEKKIKKIIVNFKIGSLEYSFVLSFILNKIWLKLDQSCTKKSILGTKFRKMKYPSTLFWVIVKQFTLF